MTKERVVRMNISVRNNSIQNRVSFQRGLYFTENPIVLFDKSAKSDFFAKKLVATSKDGFCYVANKMVPNNVKLAIANNEFVKELTEKFDTFVFVRKPFRCSAFDNYCSHMKIKWFDSLKNTVETRDVVGVSSASKKMALNTMLDKLKIKEFF